MFHNENHLLHAHAILSTTHLPSTGCFIAIKRYADQPATEGHDYLLHMGIVLASMLFSSFGDLSHRKFSSECQNLQLNDTSAMAT